MLIFGQYLVAKLSVKFGPARRAVKSEPRVLLYRGQLLQDALRRERVTPDEIESVVRGAGLCSLSQAGAVVLETDGTFHVLAQLQDDCPVLPDMEGAGR